MKFKPNTKYKITSREEMELHLHLKRKGGHTHRNKSSYQRHDKHKNTAFRLLLAVFLYPKEDPLCQTFSSFQTSI